MKVGLFDEVKKYTPSSKSRFLGNPDDFRFGRDTGLKSKSSELLLSQKSKLWNIVVFGVLMLVSFFIFLAKIYNLQIIKGEQNSSLAEGNRIRIKNIIAERGLILDRNGDILARNRPAFGIEMNLSNCGKIDCVGVLDKFSSQFDIDVDVENVKRDIEIGKETVIIASNLTKEDIIPVEVSLADFPIFSVSVTPQRDYILSEAASHLIGYVGFADTLQPIIEGKMGVESSYNPYLTGIDGGEIVQVNSSGREVSILSKEESTPGDDITLYLDRGLQELSYNLLKEKVEEGEAVAGSVVAQDPQTGGILALVSYPSFDPNKLSGGLTEQEYKEIVEGPNQPFFNRVISAVYPPASTFKMIMASAALMEDVISPEYQINDKGFIQVGSFIFRNWNLGGHGLVDMVRAIQVSNDTYFYTVGGGYGNVDGLGIDKINKWATKFGIGKLTGIDIPGEVKGFMPNSSYKDWYLGDTYITSIGQGDVLTTPLQINNITAYFANGGVLNKPRVVKSIKNRQINTSNNEENESLAKDIVDHKSYEIIREGLRKAVESGGTGYPFFDFEDTYGIKAGGKTGTAEFGTKDNEDTHAWFTVFAPFDTDKTEIALTVFLEEGGGGSDDAAPIARRLFDYWFEDYANIK